MAPPPAPLRVGRAPLLMALFVVGIGIAVAAPSTAHAQEDPELLIQQGIQLRKENDNEGAIKVLTKAYNLKRTPRAAAHLGMAEYRMSRWIDAEVHMAEALRAQNDPWIERTRAEIRKALEEVRSQLGWLEVLGRPAGAEVEVAGRPVGKLPLPQPVRLVTGEVHVRVTMDGYETDRRSVLIPSGETARVVLELTKQEARVEAPPKP
ncbi:MAG TPA: PEGA domain-containing protein, partial [Polyangia bacterium]